MWCLVLTRCAIVASMHAVSGVNVFKPGTGTITVWENTGGTRGAQLYQLKGIPLTPGPLMVVIKVASSVVSQPSKYWPPALPDAIETISVRERKQFTASIFV